MAARPTRRASTRRIGSGSSHVVRAYDVQITHQLCCLQPSAYDFLAARRSTFHRWFTHLLDAGWLLSVTFCYCRHCSCPRRRRRRAEVAVLWTYDVRTYVRTYVRTLWSCRRRLWLRGRTDVVVVSTKVVVAWTDGRCGRVIRCVRDNIHPSRMMLYDVCMLYVCARAFNVHHLSVNGSTSL